MSNRDFIPGGDLPFLEWLKRLCAYAYARISPWGIPSNVMSDLQALMGTFQNALSQAENPATRIRTGRSLPDHQVIRSVNFFFLHCTASPCLHPHKIPKNHSVSCSIVYSA
jgi:hypothetical protein